MKPNFKTFFLKGSILIGTLFLITYFMGLVPRTYISNSKICPEFGNLAEFKVPKKSILKSSGFEEIAVLNKYAEKRQVSRNFFDKALFIKNRNEFQEFLSVYEDICGGKPKFLSSIDFVRLEKMKNRKETKPNLVSSENFHQKLKKLNTEKVFLESKLSNEKKQLEKLTPIHYKIIGKVAEEGDRSLIIFGSAIPDSPSKLKSDGFVNNGVIILKNPAKKDIVSPKNSEFKHVIADDLSFFKRIDGRDSFGHFMPVFIFERKKFTLDKDKIFSIQASISKNQKKLNQIENEISSIIIHEDKFLASSF
jgi:hypothetical protein